MIVMPNHIGKCSGPILNEYIDPICEARIHVASECEDGECEDGECEGGECEGGECEGYVHPFLALSSWELPQTATYLLEKDQ